jgi:integrase
MALRSASARPTPSPADARHTTATVLAILAVPTPTAMAIMGWSSATMATRYQHVLDSILKGVAGQVGELLWDAPESDSAPDDDDGEGTAGVLAPA